MNTKRERLRAELEYNSIVKEKESFHKASLMAIEAKSKERLNSSLAFSTNKALCKKKAMEDEENSVATTLASVKEFRSDEGKGHCRSCKKSVRALYMNKI